MEKNPKLTNEKVVFAASTNRGEVTSKGFAQLFRPKKWLMLRHEDETLGVKGVV